MKWLLTIATVALICFVGILGYDAYQRDHHKPEQQIIKHNPLDFWDKVPTDANGNKTVSAK